MIDLIQHYKEKGQGQVFAHFDTLSEDAQASLIQQAEQIDLDEIAALTKTLIKGSGYKPSYSVDDLTPGSYHPLPEKKNGNPSLWKEAKAKGESALRAGRVAAFTVAGGQGTRLGYDGPKGTFPVTPVRGASLFEVFAEKIRASSRLFGKTIPWYIMTSVINHEATVSFFEENAYFGLEKERVHFFSQGTMPAVDADGKILLSDAGTIAVSPDGHGGALRGLYRSGATLQMEADGIDIISYFQVDNPLVRCIDPAFIGFHIIEKSQVSSKTVLKAYPEEKVGVFCEANGAPVVIEYSDLPERLAVEADDDGDLRFAAGSIAIHLFDREFVRVIGKGKDNSQQLPFHLAHKKIPHITHDGEQVEPSSPNGYKFEMFVFDALPFAERSVTIETARQDDFSPVKNATGVDSADSCRDDQLRQFARWLSAANEAIETDETGLPNFSFEISPLFADTETRFLRKWQALEEKPPITEGVILSNI